MELTLTSSLQPVTSYPSNALAQALLKVPFTPTVALVPNKIDAKTVPNTSLLFSDRQAVAAFLDEELNIDQADSIQQYLWLAGHSFASIRPLHRNVVIQREIVVCEQALLHLVTRDNVIFIKPIPHCMLQHDFYQEHVISRTVATKIRQRVPAFLATYLRLIRHQSDFAIAANLALIPPSATWEQWLAFRAELDAAFTDSSGKMMRFEGRYSYGELRLGRLNAIMHLFKGLPRGYVTLERQYSTYFAQFFSLIIIITVAYISIGLSAFQVALASPLATHELSLAGFWFSIVSLSILLAGVALPLLWFVVLLVNNATFAFCLRSRKQR